MISGPILCSVKQCFEIGIDEFVLICNKDVDSTTDMHDMIMALETVLEVEYSPFYGPCIFVEVNAEGNKPEVWQAIKEIIKGYAEI